MTGTCHIKLRRIDCQTLFCCRCNKLYGSMAQGNPAASFPYGDNGSFLIPACTSPFRMNRTGFRDRMKSLFVKMTECAKINKEENKCPVGSILSAD